jgi:hypothetical protein
VTGHFDSLFRISCTTISLVLTFRRANRLFSISCSETSPDGDETLYVDNESGAQNIHEAQQEAN